MTMKISNTKFYDHLLDHNIINVPGQLLNNLLIKFGYKYLLFAVYIIKSISALLDIKKTFEIRQ